mgnify:CR=1 FL=1
MQSGDFKALVQSVLDEDLELVRHYLAQGVDPNFIHPEIMALPLVEAVRVSNVSIVNLLLKNGADPKLVSPVGESALKLAKIQKNDSLIVLLQPKRKSSFSLHQLFKKFN